MGILKRENGRRTRLLSRVGCQVRRPSEDEAAHCPAINVNCVTHVAAGPIQVGLGQRLRPSAPVTAGEGDRAAGRRGEELPAAGVAVIGPHEVVQE